MLSKHRDAQILSTDKAIIPVFEKMVARAQAQGRDAAGVIHGKKSSTTRTEGTIHIAKKAVPAVEFINSGLWSKAVTSTYCNYDTLYLIGHTRAATHGTASNNENNHPFHFENAIGIHNGIISNYETLKKSHGIMKGDCDSEIIFSMIHRKISIQKLTMKEAIKQTAKQIEGWYGCVVVDPTDYRNIVIFRHRAPMSFFISRQYKMVLFASQATWVQNSWAERNKTTFPIDTLDEVHLPESCGIIVDTWKDDTWPKSVFPLLIENTEPGTDSSRSLHQAGDMAFSGGRHHNAY